MKNAQLAKEIQAKKDQANVFAHKGGRLRLVARRMREKAEELEEDIVEVIAYSTEKVDYQETNGTATIAW